MPFFISLMKNLFDKNFPSPEPIINKNGNYISEISEKKAAVVSFLDGYAKKILNPNDCYEVGINTAKLHLITKDLSGKEKINFQSILGEKSIIKLKKIALKFIQIYQK